MLFGIADYSAFCAAVLVFLALPGPGTLALLTATGQSGFRAGAATTLGLILGDQVLMWLAVAGVATVLAAHPAAFRVVQAGGAIYLGWLGLRLISAPDGAAPVMRMVPRHHVRQGLMITVFNPKAIVFYMAFFPLFIEPTSHPGLPTFAAMAGTIALITAVYCLALCAAAAGVSRHFARHPRLGRWLRRGAGVGLLAFGIKLLNDQG